MYDRTAQNRACEIRKSWSPVERFLRAVAGQSRREAFVSMLSGAPRQRDPDWDPSWAVGAMSPADVRRVAG